MTGNSKELNKAIPFLKTDKQVTNNDREQSSMRDEEYVLLRRLLMDMRPRNTLEVGMANGSSSVIFCEVLKEVGGEKHIAIDPFQSKPDVWDGKGIEKVRKKGLAGYLEFIDDFDYIALPRLVKEQKTFDFILIDAYHTFDYTFIDLFYADLLLRTNGVVAIHDSGEPGVYKACKFLELHKPYIRISPSLIVCVPSLVGRAFRRIKWIMSGSAVRTDERRRRTEWFSIAAYQKKEHKQVPERFHVDF